MKWDGKLFLLLTVNDSIFLGLVFGFAALYKAIVLFAQESLSLLGTVITPTVVFVLLAAIYFLVLLLIYSLSKAVCIFLIVSHTPVKHAVNKVKNGFSRRYVLGNGIMLLLWSIGLLLGLWLIGFLFLPRLHKPLQVIYLVITSFFWYPVITELQLLLLDKKKVKLKKWKLKEAIRPAMVGLVIAVIYFLMVGGIHRALLYFATKGLISRTIGAQYTSVLLIVTTFVLYVLFSWYRHQIVTTTAKK